MPGHDGGDPVGIEMSEVEMEEDHDDQDNPPGDNRTAKESPYKMKFGNILKSYDDERTWWDAVKDLLDSDGNFAANVSCSPGEDYPVYFSPVALSYLSCGVHHLLQLANSSRILSDTHIEKKKQLPSQARGFHATC